MLFACLLVLVLMTLFRRRIKTYITVLPSDLEIIARHILDCLMKNRKGIALKPEVKERIIAANSTIGCSLYNRVTSTIRKYRSTVNENNHSYQQMLKKEILGYEQVEVRKQKKKKTVYNADKVSSIFSL